MQIIKKWIFIFIVFFSLHPVVLQAKHMTFREKYALALKHAKKINSFSASFTQKFYSALRNKVTKSEGRLMVQKPSSFRYEILSPHTELYIANGVDFWKYIPSLHHAQHLYVNTAELNFFNILTDFSHLRHFYSVLPWTHADADELVKEDKTNAEKGKKSKTTLDAELVNFYTPPSQKNGLIYVKLIPRGDKLQKVLYAIIEMKTGLVQELRIVQLNGNRTQLAFTSYSMESVLPEMFKFTPPDGTAVNDVKNME